MILDHDRRVVWVHVPKTGGTAIMLTLGPQVATGMVSGDGEEKHWSAQRIRREFIGTEWRSWTWAAAVRNPWDMIVSDYEFCRHHAKRINKMRRITSLGGWLNKLESTLTCKTFGDFVNLHYLRSPEFPNRVNVWDHYCTDWNGTDIVTRILRFESLGQDYEQFCRDFGYTVSKLPVRNKTPNRTPYQQMYDKTLADRVGEFYAEYNRRFGYTFEGSNT